MGCTNLKQSKQLCLDLFDIKSFPELRSISYAKFRDVLLDFATRKGFSSKVTKLRKKDWKEIIKTILVIDRVDEYSEIQEIFLKKIYNVAYNLRQGKQLKEYILLLLFPFFDQSEQEEINFDDKKIDLDMNGEDNENNNNSEENNNKDKIERMTDTTQHPKFGKSLKKKSIVEDPPQVIKDFYELLLFLGEGVLTFQNANFFLVYYFASTIRGVSYLLAESFEGSKYYDFKEVNEEKLTKLNFKKFFYHIFNDFLEEINLRYHNQEIPNMYNYNLTLDDFNKLFGTKLYLLNYEGLIVAYWNYLTYIEANEDD